MIDIDDPCLDRLAERYFGELFAEIPNLARVRAYEAQLLDYIVWCLSNRLWEKSEQPDRRPDLSVITNDGPLQPNPRSMSSPLKTDEIRRFEAHVGHIFGIRASAMMEWPAKVSASALTVESGTSGNKKACHQIAQTNS
jgi:hypothetical protein